MLRVWEREREWSRTRVCMNVCEWERACVKESVCVWERERECVLACVCTRECARARVCKAYGFIYACVSAQTNQLLLDLIRYFFLFPFYQFRFYSFTLDFICYSRHFLNLVFIVLLPRQWSSCSSSVDTKPFLWLFFFFWRGSDCTFVVCFGFLVAFYLWLASEKRKKKKKKKTNYKNHHLKKGHFDVLGMVLVLKILACSTAVMSFSSARVVCMASRRLHDVINTTL